MISRRRTAQMRQRAITHHTPKSVPDRLITTRRPRHRPGPTRCLRWPLPGPNSRALTSHRDTTSLHGCLVYTRLKRGIVEIRPRRGTRAHALEQTDSIPARAHMSSWDGHLRHATHMIECVRMCVAHIDDLRTVYVC